jgi:hypothetical protein
MVKAPIAPCCTLLVEVTQLAKEGRFDYLVIESTGSSEALPLAESFTFADTTGSRVDFAHMLAGTQLWLRLRSRGRKGNAIPARYLRQPVQYWLDAENWFEGRASEVSWRRNGGDLAGRAPATEVQLTSTSGIARFIVPISGCGHDSNQCLFSPASGTLIWWS